MNIHFTTHSPTLAFILLTCLIMPAQAVPDVLGISLGMTPDQVAKAMQAHAAELRQRPSILTIQLTARDPATGRAVALPNGKYVAQYAIGEARQEITGSDGEDELSVNFSPRPGKEGAAAIYRRLGFKPGEAPLNTNLLADLRRKYGPPSFEVPPTTGLASSELLWAFDEAGKAVVSHGGQRCMVPLPAPTAYVRSPTAPESPWEQPIVQAWSSTETYYRACGTSVLRVRTTTDRNLGTTSRLYVTYQAVKDVIQAQQGANDLMRRGEESAKGEAVKGAGQVKAPRL